MVEGAAEWIALKTRMNCIDFHNSLRILWIIESIKMIETLQVKE